MQAVGSSETSVAIDKYALRDVPENMTSQEMHSLTSAALLNT